MAINLSFGNPNREYLGILKQETYLDTLLTELKNYQPSGYDSPEVQQELAAITPLCNSLYAEPEVEKRYRIYDNNFVNYLVLTIVDAGVNQQAVEQIIEDINDDITPLLIKLKYHYQRIRPAQLAIYFNIPLYPYISITTITPAYPSGHTFQAKVYCEVLGNRYPKLYNLLMGIAEDIAQSRLCLGLNYHSDCEFGKYCADLVLNHPDFKKKYEL